MKRKKILIAILILGIIGAFIAYKTYNKPHVNVANAKPDVSLTANKILNDFSSDENDANAKYLEKIIEVKGEIVSLKSEKGLGIISLKTNDDFGTVLCHLSKSSTKKMQNFKEGQTISVKGICTGYLMDVILVKCEILTN